jgi:hypothetical protein
MLYSTQSNVILSEVSGSRSEADTQSKDPYNADCSADAARHSLRTANYANGIH